MTSPDYRAAMGASTGRQADAEAEFESFDDDEFTEAGDDEAAEAAEAGDDEIGDAEIGDDETIEGDDADELDDEFDDEDGDDEDEIDDYNEDDYDEAAKAKLAAALAKIDAEFGKKPAEQVEAFTEAQQTLQATLARIDTN